MTDYKTMWDALRASVRGIIIAVMPDEMTPGTERAEKRAKAEMAQTILNEMEWLEKPKET